MNWKQTLLACFLILILGGAVTTLIFSTEPTATSTGATQQTAMLVDVKTIQAGTFTPTIKAMGTVEPAQDIMLSPRVNGDVMQISQKFTPGGYVEKGDTLLQINPEDYKNTLQQRKSELQQAQSDLDLEMGRQEAAQKEYSMYDDTVTLSSANKARVLRQPQLKAAKAQVQSARASVEQAKLDLKRTTITAPFNAHILNRNVNTGSQVGAGDNRGRLVGFNEYWIEATVPLSKLRWLTIPDDGKRGSEVVVRNRTAWNDDEYRTGYVHKLIGSLEGQTRMSRVLISVPDPHAYHDDSADKPRLMIGSYVEASIKGNELSDVIRLNRDYLRGNQKVWVMEGGKLDIRIVDIVLQDATYAYISDGLNPDDQIVTTNLSSPTQGAPLRLEESETPTRTSE